MESKTMKAVFTVIDRGPGKSYWTRIGVGFVNSDGSINLRLDALPVNGTLQVREWETYDRRGAADGNNAPGQGAQGAQGEGRFRRREAPRDVVADTFPGDALV